MQEHQLYELWQFYASSGKTITHSGHNLKIIHPGFLNTARGPDFRSARFMLDGILQQGDVECHIHQQDWYRHHHHLDAAFSNVLLHVVSSQEKHIDQVTHTQTIKPILTMPLPAIKQKHLPMNCPIDKHDIPVLLTLAQQKFQGKSRQFHSMLHTTTAHQIFYEHYFRALGYNANTTAFQHLAANLPWSWLTSQLYNGVIQSQLLALYAGQAGFIRTPAKDPFSKKLSDYFTQQQYLLDHAALKPAEWQFACVRPFNHPHFRLAGWVALLFAHASDPFSFLSSLLSRRLPFETSYKKLLIYFRIPCDNYWTNHIALGKRRSGTKARYFLGPARITEILTNLVFPLLHAQALKTKSDGFAAYLEDFYAWLPTVSNYASIAKEFRSIFLNPDQIKFQAISQGLLFLKNHFCATQKCHICPLNYKKH